MHATRNYSSLDLVRSPGARIAPLAGTDRLGAGVTSSVWWGGCPGQEDPTRSVAERAPPSGLRIVVLTRPVRPLARLMRPAEALLQGSCEDAAAGTRARAAVAVPRLVCWLALLAAAAQGATAQGAAPEPEPERAPEPEPPPPQSPCEPAAIPHSDKDAGNECAGKTGEVCEFRCDPGYLDTTTNSKTGSITCEASGEFSSPPQLCVAQPCELAPAIEHSDKDAGHECAGKTGDSCHYTCKPGFALDDSSGKNGVITCQPNGHFSAVQQKCVPQACADKTINNTTGPTGVTLCQGVTGSTCAYTCAQGYSDETSHSASGSVTCLPSGRFSDGSCEGNLCPSVVIDHTLGESGSTTCSGRRTMESCRYECAAGYSDSGSGTRTCGADGLFSPGSCEPNVCAPVQIAHTVEGVTVCTGVTGEDCPFTCADGYSGGGTVTCDANTGAFTSGTCDPKSCTSLVVDHTTDPSGSTTCTGHTDDVCHFTCAKGYRETTGSDGAMQVQCNARGHDKPQFPAKECAAETCAGMAVPNSDKVGADKCTGTTGQDCPFQCNPGYSIGGTGQLDDNSGRITCGTNGKFSEAACDANTCRELPIDHTVPTPGNNKWWDNTTQKIVCSGRTGERCAYTCKAGFDDSGDGEVVCGSDGNFPTVSCGGQKCNDKSISHTTAGQTKCAGHTEDVCRFTCSSGYENPFRKLGSNTNTENKIECQADHFFEHGDCIPKDCEPLTIEKSGPTTTTPWSPDRETTCAGKFDDPACTFSCAQGFGIGGQTDQLSGSISCKSRLSAQPSYDPMACIDIDECAENNAGCSPGAVCVNTEGSFFCAGCQGMQQGVAGACCNPDTGPGGRRTSGPEYGPTELCCAPAPAPVYGLAPPPAPPDGADCSIGGSPGHCNVLASSHSWLEDLDGNNTGCIGIPSATHSQVELFAAIGGIHGVWTWYAFGTPLAAGTPLHIGIDPKDARGQRNAQLKGLCEASTFTVSSERDIHVDTLEFFQDVEMDTARCDSDLCADIAEQYYAASLHVNSTGNYFLTVSSSSLAWHGMAQVGGSVIIVPAVPDVVQSEVVGNDILSSHCIVSGACKSKPSNADLLSFGVTIFDKFKNPRNDQDAVHLKVDGDVKSSGRYSTQHFNIGFSSLDDSATPVIIEIVASCTHATLPETTCFDDISLQSFKFTVHDAAPDELNKLFSIGSGRAPEPTMFAGHTDPFTVIVSDDQCQGADTCEYWPQNVNDPCDCEPIDRPKGCTKHRLLVGTTNGTVLGTHRRLLGKGNRRRSSSPPPPAPCVTTCSKKCIADPCPHLPVTYDHNNIIVNGCECPQYSTVTGCVQSNNLEADVKIVAVATRGVLRSDRPVYGGSTMSTAKYPPGDCLESNLAHPACLDFVFDPHIAGVYRVALHLGDQGKLTFGLQSEWEVVVNPAKLDYEKSQPGHCFDFETSEAGRNNTFCIYPRDRFGNLRIPELIPELPWENYTLENGNDVPSLSVSGPEFPEGAQGSYFWDPEKHRFEVSRRITIAGVYTFVVQMGGLDRDLISKTVTVFAAATDVGNTVVELYSQGPNFPAEDGGDPGYLLELKNSAYSVDTTIGRCTYLPNRAQPSAMGCAALCREQERCRLFSVSIDDQTNGSTSGPQCCLKEDVDPFSTQTSYPVERGYHLYRLVRQDSSPQPPLQPRATFAGAINTFWFTARDTFGNVRSNNDTCTVSYSATPGGQADVSQQWQGERYAVTFRSTVSRPVPYNVSVTLSTNLNGRPADQIMVPGSPFSVAVWPAQLDISRSGNPGPQFLGYRDLSNTWLGSSACGSPCRQTVAGAINNFSVIPKDGFGNVQDRHPSPFSLQTPDALFATFNCSAQKSAEWCNLGDSHHMDTRWDTSAHLYRAQMNQLDSITKTGSYSLAVQLGNAVSPHDDTTWRVSVAALHPYGAPVSLPLTPMTVFVRPADLSPAHCGPGNGRDPELFESTEAGRVSQFPVVPRDRYFNVRNQTLFGLSDSVTLEIFPNRQQKVDSPVWKDNAPLWDGSDAPVLPHFAASFRISVAGDYSLEIKIKCDPGPGEHREGLRRIPLDFVGGHSAVPITVLPGTLDSTNTRFLSTFNSMPGDQDADTVGTLPTRVFMTFLAFTFSVITN